MKLKRLSPLKACRCMCLGCMNNQYKQIKYCHLTDCPIWCLRFGRMPQTIIRSDGPEAAELFDPANFSEGAKYGPDIDIDTVE